MPEIISSRYSADLTDVIKKYGYDSKFNKQVLNAVSKDGKIYALPTNAYVLGIACNINLFEQAGLMNSDGTPMQPKTWDEVVEFAVKIKEKTGKSGFVLPTTDKNGGWIFTPIAWSFGVKFMESDKDGNWKATFDSDECVAALQWIKDLKWKYDVLPSNILVGSAEVGKEIAIDDAGMAVCAAGFPGQVLAYDMQPNDLGMMAMPAGPKRHVTLLGGEVVCIRENSTEDQIDAAFRWYQTAYDYRLTDSVQDSNIKKLDSMKNRNELIGVKKMSIWANDVESVKWQNTMIDKYANCNINHVKLYNDFVMNCPADIQAEEPVCAQELYEILDGCIQEVLTNKNANCKKIIANAASDFQKNYLDNLTY